MGDYVNTTISTVSGKIELNEIPNEEGHYEKLNYGIDLAAPVKKTIDNNNLKRKGVVIFVILFNCVVSVVTGVLTGYIVLNISRNDQNEWGNVAAEQIKANGSWSTWSAWGSCSVSCGIGLQKRVRSCSNPFSSRFGDHCFGDSRDDRICLPGACADGGWSNWNSWEACSVTCGGGIRTRYRLCNNPTPSQFGRDCPGDAHETAACGTSSCPAGGWSSWHSWGACSATCGGGIRTRSRPCDNPAPSPFGLYCIGDAVKTGACNSKRCPDLISAFTVTVPYSIVSSSLTFSKTLLNEGGDFNVTSGKFTCSKPGVYYFSASLIKKRTGNTRVIDTMGCYIFKNGSSVLLIFIDPTDDATDGGSAQADNSALLHLNRGDVVYLGSCSDPTTHMESYSSFSGFLVNPDYV